MVVNKHVKRDMNANGMPIHALSDREGLENMDGQFLLTISNRFDKSHFRPWDHCILVDELSKDKLPPFFIRLRDDQAASLQAWVLNKNNKSLSQRDLSIFWPLDFDTQAKLRPSRDSWGGVCHGKVSKLPAYEAPSLPPTFTSSGKFMTKELVSSLTTRGPKRKADSPPEVGIPIPEKKARVWKDEPPMALVSENKGQRVTRSTTRSDDDQARSYIDNLIANKAAAKQEIATLRRQIEAERATHQSDLDALHDSWLKYTESKERTIATNFEEMRTSNDTLQRNLSISRVEEKQRKAAVRELKDQVKRRGKRLMQLQDAYIDHMSELANQLRKTAEDDCCMDSAFDYQSEGQDSDDNSGSEEEEDDDGDGDDGASQTEEKVSTTTPVPQNSEAAKEEASTNPHTDNSLANNPTPTNPPDTPANDQNHTPTQTPENPPPNQILTNPPQQTLNNPTPETSPLPKAAGLEPPAAAEPYHHHQPTSLLKLLNRLPPSYLQTKLSAQQRSKLAQALAREMGLFEFKRAVVKREEETVQGKGRKG